MGGTWDHDPDDFLLRVFFLDFFPDPPSPLDWTFFPPLVTAVLIKVYWSNRCDGLFSSIQDRLGQTFLSLAGPVAH